MKLRKPCEHDRYDAHPWDSLTNVCPGGVFLPDDTAPDLARVRQAIDSIEAYYRDLDPNSTLRQLQHTVNAAAEWVLDALSVREAPEVDKNQMGMW